MLKPETSSGKAVLPWALKVAVVEFGDNWSAAFKENNDFNVVVFGEIIGVHINDDIINNPDIEYGDLDCLITLPFHKQFEDDWTCRKK